MARLEKNNYKSIQKNELNDASRVYLNGKNIPATVCVCGHI